MKKSSVRKNYLYSFNVFCAFLVSFLFVLYIFQINFETSERFLVRQYERKVAELSTETRSLEMAFAKKGSLRELIPLLESMDFQELDRVSYIEIIDQQVVVK